MLPHCNLPPIPPATYSFRMFCLAGGGGRSLLQAGARSGGHVLSGGRGQWALDSFCNSQNSKYLNFSLHHICAFAKCHCIAPHFCDFFGNLKFTTSPHTRYIPIHCQCMVPHLDALHLRLAFPFLSESGFSLVTHCLWPFWLDSSLSLHLWLLQLSHYLSDSGGTNRVP